MPARLMAASSSTLTVIPASLAIRLTRLAKAAAVREPPGSFVRSRARVTPPATATAVSTATRMPTAVLPTSVTFARVSVSPPDPVFER